MQIAGTPSIAASSSKLMQRPVFPLPVIPTQAACVVRSFESYKDRGVLDRLRLCVEPSPEIKDAQLLEIDHGVCACGLSAR